MTIFGIRITSERTYRAERAADLAAHVDECNQHLRQYRELQRKIDELDMQRKWWRLQYETLRAAPRTITVKPVAMGVDSGVRIEVSE